MHHVAVALERHHLVDLHGAELDDPTDVVAGQVDEHDVLGDLLRVLDSSAAMRRSSSSVRPRRRVPAIGREMTVPSSSCTSGSGDEPTRVTPGWRTKYMYGLGFTWRRTR